MKVVQGSTPAAIHIGRDCSCQKDQYFTWDDGERKCLEEQSHLASVHSYEENEYISSLFRSRITIEMVYLKTALKCSERHFMEKVGMIVLAKAIKLKQQFAKSLLEDVH
uniref:C-type lectin domain-containing protein n=1 Tax=Ditylenchus dipsaci TaxID=166011 RepID=A0A915DMB4_9BILA